MQQCTLIVRDCPLLSGFSSQLEHHWEPNSEPNSYLGADGKIGLTPARPIKHRRGFDPIKPPVTLRRPLRKWHELGTQTPRATSYSTRGPRLLERHGARRHTNAHAEVAQLCGISDSDCFKTPPVDTAVSAQILLALATNGSRGNSSAPAERMEPVKKEASGSLPHRRLHLLRPKE
jgi:hypothetical protein